MKTKLPTVFVLLLALSLLISSCGRGQESEATVTTAPATTSTPALAPTSASVTTSTLFFVDNIERLKYRFTLYDLRTKKLNSQIVDFSITGWDVTLGLSRFNVVNGGETIHYNPLTKEIVFLLFPGPEGEGGWKPADALPNPPFQFAIYKTSFDAPNQFTQLYAETAPGLFVAHAVLNPQTDSLFLDVIPSGKTYSEVSQPEILKFDLATRQFEKIIKIKMNLAGKDLAERSDLRLSPDGQKLYQLVLYGDPRKWVDETVYLMTLDLQGRSARYQEMVTGGNVQYDILAISADGQRVVYYTLDTGQQYHLWVRDFGNGDVKSIPLSGEVGNFSLFMTNDGQKILAGFQQRTQEITRRYWQIYDLNSNGYQAIPLDRPLAWDSSGRYLAGIKDDLYIIYDIETQTELNLGLSLSNDYEIQSAQWR